MPKLSCSECNARLPFEAESCPDCGYPVSRSLSTDPDHGQETLQATLTEYRRIRMLGVGVAAVGAAASLADSPMAAAVAVTVGVGTYVVGLLGTWWNTSE